MIQVWPVWLLLDPFSDQVNDIGEVPPETWAYNVTELPVTMLVAFDERTTESGSATPVTVRLVNADAVLPFASVTKTHTLKLPRESGIQGRLATLAL